MTAKDVAIRSELKPGDLGYLIHLHGLLYAREYGYGLGFESYVAEGLCEFCSRYDPDADRLWICEAGGRMVGSLFAMHRPEAAQLRYFLVDPAYRGQGLGTRLMGSCMDFLRERGYARAYLWTTDELIEAARIYERFGFRLGEERESTTFGKRLVERRYQVELRSPTP